MARVLIACVIALLLALPAVPAPAPKESDKPLAPATQEQRDKSLNYLKQFGLGMHNHHDVFGFLPRNFMTKDGKPGLSWRVAILPFIEQEELYKEFKLDEPWDSEHNLKLVERIPKIYTPLRGKAEKGQTFYQMFAGNSTMLGSADKRLTMADVVDGLSNTFMVVEGEKPVIWTKPDDLPYDGKALPKLGGMFDGEFHALFGDGSVRRIPKGMDADALKSLIERNDGRDVNVEDEIKKAEGK
jgi:hypothetical protein